MSRGQRSNSILVRLFGAAALFSVIGTVLEYRSGTVTIAWRTLDTALQEAAVVGKPVYVDVYAEWCAPCKTMDRQTFTNDSVAQLLSSGYIPARIDIDTKEFTDSLRKSWHLRGVPTSIVMSPYGLEIGRRTGFLPPRDLMRWLNDPALMAFSAWLNIEDSRIRARKEGERLLLVVTGNSENTEELQEFFVDSTMQSFVYRNFVPSLLTMERYEHAFWLDSLSGRPAVESIPRGGMVLIVATAEPKMIGQLAVSAEEFDDQARIRERLRGYIASRN